jgi:integrase
MIIARVFHRDGEPVESFPYIAWRSACKRAGIAGRRPHDFRRTMARNYRRSDEAEGVIMKIGGWKTLSSSATTSWPRTISGEQPSA